MQDSNIIQNPTTQRTHKKVQIKKRLHKNPHKSGTFATNTHRNFEQHFQEMQPQT